MSHNVFVYGTLKRKHKNHTILQHSKYIGEALTPPLFRMYNLGAFPAIVDDANGYSIHGELYSVDDRTLYDLDMLEGAYRKSGLYRRELITLNNGVSAFIYVFNSPHHISGYPQLPSGEWLISSYTY